MSDKKRYAYRLDDITEDMDWDKFFRMQEIFDRYQICPLIGVVPANKDVKLKPGKVRPDFFTIVRELQEKGWCVAQHGYEHVYETKESGLLGLKRASEFAGLSFARQEEKIRLGKEILQKNGILSDIFMAPGHTYDDTTLRALVENGFRTVTDGYADCVYGYEGLQFIPCKSTDIPSRGTIDTICLHVNEMQEADFEEVEREIAQKRAWIVDYSELLQRKAVPYFGKARFQEKRNLWVRAMKKRLTTGREMQEYLQKTNSTNSWVKRGKRLIGLPGLIGRLLWNRNGE